MAEVNEEIVAQYLTIIRKWFIVPDISFPVPSNYSNIDILAFDPKQERYYDIEIKYRSKYTLSAKNRKGEDTTIDSVQWLVDQFREYPSRETAISEYIGSKPCTKVLITTKQLFGHSEEKQSALENAFLAEMVKAGYQDPEIWYFDVIFPELVEAISRDGSHKTQLLQTIRLIKTYVH